MATKSEKEMGRMLDYSLGESLRVEYGYFGRENHCEWSQGYWAGILAGKLGMYLTAGFIDFKVFDALRFSECFQGP